MSLAVCIRPLLLLVGACWLTACSPGEGTVDLVIYVALDRAHSEPVIAAFEQATGLRVEAHYDVEANKSVGLRRRLQEEAARPLCDVFWNNEVVQTVLLAEAGLLQPYHSPAAAGLPTWARDSAGYWTGFAARGRVLIVNTALRPHSSQWPTGTLDFLVPANAGRCGMAKPLTGTTAAHAGWWLSELGREATLDLLNRYLANDVRFGPGNAHLMRLVRAGELDFGWTDTDDCAAALFEGFPVAQVVPDQGEGQLGMLVIPNTVALVANAPRAAAGRQFIDYLLSPAVEEQLARGPSAQIPLRAKVPRPENVLNISELRVATVDWALAGRAYAEQVGSLEALFNR